MALEIDQEQAVEIKAMLKEFFLWMYKNGTSRVTLERTEKELKIEFGDIEDGCTPTDANKLREFNQSLADENSRLKSLVDGAYEIVELWNSDSAKAPANVKWKKEWLMKARALVPQY